MNPLYEKFPDYVEVRGRRCRIVTDFREWIKLSELLGSAGRLNGKVLDMVLGWYIDPPDSVTEGVYALQRFLAAAELYENDGRSLEGNQGCGKPVYSFEHDARCIYSDFLRCYGIDLEQVPYMHWWKFLILFEGLPQDTETKERIYYRSVNLNEIKDKEERKRIKEIKKRIALPTRKSGPDDYQIGEFFG